MGLDILGIREKVIVIVGIFYVVSFLWELVIWYFNSYVFLRIDFFILVFFKNVYECFKYIMFFELII